jgi:hypothetical protein
MITFNYEADPQKEFIGYAFHNGERVSFRPCSPYESVEHIFKSIPKMLEDVQK